MVFLFIFFGFISAQAQIGGSSAPVLIHSTVPKTNEALVHGRYEIKKSKPTGKPSNRVPVLSDRKPANEAQAPVAKVIQYKDPEIVPENYESRDNLPDDDVRKNQMEIQASPAFVYNGSTSNYSYRSYSSFFPALDLSSNVWMTPTLGLHGRILFSLGASVAGDSVTSSRVPVKYENIDLAFKFRRYYSSLKDSQTVDISVLYSEDKFSSPSDNLYRPKLSSSGLGINVTSRLPRGNNFTWVLGGLFYPRLQHQEEKVGLKISSGTATENTRLGVNVGTEMKFSRSSQIIYDLALRTEQNFFNGSASPVDPETKNSPSNVNVTNSTLIFSFGYRWGR